MVGFVHFSNFFIPSEKYYKLQSCWITLYYIHTVVEVTMNVPKYTSSRQSATGAAKEYQYLNQLRKEDLKMIFLMGPSVKSVSNK